MSGKDWTIILDVQALRLSNAAEDLERLLDQRSVTRAKAAKARAFIAKAAAEHDDVLSAMAAEGVGPDLLNAATDIRDLWTRLDGWAAARLREIKKSSQRQ